MAHIFAVRPSALRENLAISGRTTVMVFSVKSCMRPRITSRNPTL